MADAKGAKKKRPSAKIVLAMGIGMPENEPARIKSQKAIRFTKQTMQNHFHCDMNLISPPSGDFQPTASQLISVPGLYERTFHPERASLWIETESEKQPSKSERDFLAEFC